MIAFLKHLICGTPRRPSDPAPKLNDIREWLMEDIHAGPYTIPMWKLVLEHFEEVPITKRDWWYADFMRLLRKTGEDHKEDDNA